LLAQAREEGRRLARLRKTMVEAQARYLAAQAELAEAESKDADLQHDITRVEEISSRMLRREMQVLGVMDSLDNEQEIALAICETWAVWPVVTLTRSSERSPSPIGRSILGSVAKSWLDILSKSPATS
jgi:hypothetical protein